MSLTDEDVLGFLRKTGAIRHGHFQLTSGRHSDTYVQCARVLEDPELAKQLADELVRRLGRPRVDAVAAPAVGGVVLGFAVAQSLGVRFIFSERQAGEMVFRRGFAVRPGERVLVVEDVVTTGGSVAEVIDLVRRAGGEAVAVASIIDRGGPKAFDVPFVPLLTLEVESWEPRECRLCRDGVDLDSPGSRRLSG